MFADYAVLIRTGTNHINNLDLIMNLLSMLNAKLNVVSLIARPVLMRNILY